MARTADRLPVFSSTGPSPTFDLTEEQFFELARLLNADALSDDARQGMLSICRGYLHSRSAEIGAGMQKEAHEIWQATREAVAGFIALGEGSYPPHGDAGSVVEDAFWSALIDGPSIQLTEADTEPRTLDLQHSKGHVAIAQHLNLSKDFLMRLSSALRQATERADHTIANLGKGFAPGRAFKSWLADMREWAKANSLPYGAASKGVGELTPFPKFLFCLNGFFPADLRENVASDEAMNMRLSRQVYGAHTSTI